MAPDVPLVPSLMHMADRLDSEVLFNLVKENNKTYSTVRFGTIFFDYK